MTKKNEALTKIKEMLSKHPAFKNVDVEIVFKDKNTKENMKDKLNWKDIICKN